jgi:hypothetical protein
MILEGLVTTMDADGSPHLAPMGALIEADMSQFTLRPYRTSRTGDNLRRSPQGVLHVTDDVELLARAAVHRFETPPLMRRADAVDGFILEDTCRWYAFRVQQIQDAGPRTDMVCTVVDHGRKRDFLGFNRAKHAVVEAAILATRVRLLDAESLRQELARLAVIVDKTAGAQERRAFDCLREFVRQELGDSAN